MGIWPSQGPVTPTIITTYSRCMLGRELMAQAAPAPSSSGITAAVNTSMFYPVIVPDTIVIVKLFCANGATLVGNVDLGIYDESGARLISSGSTAHAGTSVLQEFDITDTELSKGRYYFGLGCSSNSTTFQIQYAGTQNPDIQINKLMGVLVQFTFPLPATATFLALSNAGFDFGIPCIGMSGRTLVT